MYKHTTGKTQIVGVGVEYLDIMEELTNDWRKQHIRTS
jgi:hypothetical protein